ncbi:hypothetical protein MKW92_004429, partial [Papaver armeniacum]
YTFDYIFDWTILKYPQAQRTKSQPRLYQQAQKTKSQPEFSVSALLLGCLIIFLLGNSIL